MKNQTEVRSFQLMARFFMVFLLFHAVPLWAEDQKAGQLDLFCANGDFQQYGFEFKPYVSSAATVTQSRGTDAVSAMSSSLSSIDFSVQPGLKIEKKITEDLSIYVDNKVIRNIQTNIFTSKISIGYRF